MASITRAEKTGPIFSRVTGVLRSGVLKWEDRPVWFDVYAAFPPPFTPLWDLKYPKRDEPVRQLMYTEDVVRAFVEAFEQQRIANPKLTEDELFDQTVSQLNERGGFQLIPNWPRRSIGLRVTKFEADDESPDLHAAESTSSSEKTDAHDKEEV